MNSRLSVRRTRAHAFSGSGRADDARPVEMEKRRTEAYVAYILHALSDAFVPYPTRTYSSTYNAAHSLLVAVNLGSFLSFRCWVGTWSTAPQLVEPGNMPPSPGLTNNSLRQVVRVSIGGDTLRVRFTNEFSTSAVSIKSVQIAASTAAAH